jgi:hypothetical protein
MEPLLLRARSGRIAAGAIAFGFGGGTLLLGTVSLLAGAAREPGALPAVGAGLLGYAIAATPFFVLAAVVALCRSELWFDPEARMFRLLTFRPWRRGPAIEQAPLSDYAGVRCEPAEERHGGGFLVSLVAAEGEVVPMRQFSAENEARAFAERLGEASGLWVR